LHTKGAFSDPKKRAMLTLTLLTCLAFAYATCPEGRIEDLDGRCVPRFKLPKRKPCVKPEEFPHGSASVSLGGRVVKYECEEGWELVSAPFLFH